MQIRFTSFIKRLVRTSFKKKIFHKIFFICRATAEDSLECAYFKEQPLRKFMYYGFVLSSVSMQDYKIIHAICPGGTEKSRNFDPLKPVPAGRPFSRKICFAPESMWSVK